MFLNMKFPSFTQLFRNVNFFFLCFLAKVISSFSTAMIIGAHCFKMHSVVAGFLPSLPKRPPTAFLLLLLCFLIGSCWASNKTKFTKYCLLKGKDKNLTVLCWVQRQQKIKLKQGESKIRHSLRCPQTNPSSFPPFPIAREQESETSSLGKYGYDFEAEGSWERERKYFRRSRLYKCFEERKEEYTHLLLYPSNMPIRDPHPSHPILYTFHKHPPSLRQNGPIIPLCSTCTLNKLLAESGTPYCIYWFRESECPP